MVATTLNPARRGNNADKALQLSTWDHAGDDRGAGASPRRGPVSGNGLAV